MKPQKHKSITQSLVLFVFVVMLISVSIVGIITFTLVQAGIITLPILPGAENGYCYVHILIPFLSLLGLCVLIATILAAIFGRKAFSHVHEVIVATEKIADGDYTVKIQTTGGGELERLSQSFNKMTQELSSVQTMRSDFINNFSHEFKTPITSIKGFAKLLREEDLTEKDRNEYLDIIIRQSERLAHLSTNILNMSKYENIEIVTDKRPFRIDEQIRKVIVLLEQKWVGKNITLNVDLAPITYNGNEDLTQQIWINLLDNAIQYGYNGGLINIDLSENDGWICFAIQDDGQGMNEYTRKHAFDKFYQEEKSDKKNGNGLGLTLVKRIVEIYGGDIHLESELGKGSMFTVMIPNQLSLCDNSM